MRHGGFTLIEVLIAMTLLAFISIAVYQATTRSFDVNHRLRSEANDLTEISLSLSVFETDVSQIFSPPFPKEEKPLASTQQPSQFWSAPVRPDGMRRSRLTGSREKLSFVTNSNRRLERGQTQSDFLKITYEIEQNQSGSYSLYRTMDWDAFNYEDGRMKSRKNKRVALVDNLRSAKFSFYRKANKSWDDTWDSEGAFAKAEERYPDLISLKVETPDPTNNANNQVWEVTVKPHLTLNQAPGTGNPAQGGQP